MRQSANAGAHDWQFPFGSRNHPNLVVHEQLLDVYSSGQPKMWPVSWVKTRSMLSGPQPSFGHWNTILGLSAYAKCATGYLVKKPTYAQRVPRSWRIRLA